MPEREYFDIAILVPLEEELSVVNAVFPTIEDRTTEEAYRAVVSSPDSELKILLVQQEMEGRTYASKAANDIFRDFEIGLIVCLGIAGCLTADLRLCDVVYTGEVIDVLDNAKVSDTGEDDDRQMSIEFSPQRYETVREATHAFNLVRLLEELKPLYREWQQHRYAEASSLVPLPFPGRGEIEERIELPRTKNGKIVCGDVSKSAIYNSKLSGSDRKALAIETESGGVFAVAKHFRIPALTLRGLCDHADAQKNKLESVTGGLIRAIAVKNAATFLHLQIQNPRFKSFLKGRRAHCRIEDRGDQETLPLNDLQSIIRDAQSLVDEKLGEISFEMKHREKGYRLPVPRVQRTHDNTITENTNDTSESEIFDCLSGFPVMLLNIPKGYPDNSLPWIIADYILSITNDNEQFIPVVIEGSRIRPPVRGIFAAAERDLLRRCVESPTAKPIVIIEDMPLQSPTRMDYLIKELHSLAGINIVMICRDSANAVVQEDLKLRARAERFTLCNIPFIELAYFIERSFSLPLSEAEVLALKLRDTFAQFELSAHPSYFAGIPREVLFKLLDANGRAELLGLAVDGFMLLVVAEDKATVRLTKSKRAEYLRRLVIEINVEKQTFSQEGLVSHVREYASRFDLEIDPLQFIGDFIDKGILHFSEDRVHFSMSFMERYFLAIELSNNSELAQRYFQFGSDFFDFDTFDLYCEIKPSLEIIASVQAVITSTMDNYKDFESRGHILLGDQLSPAFLLDVARFVRVQKRLGKLNEDVNNQTTNTQEKQQVLDLADRVKKNTEERSDIEQSESFSEIIKIANVMTTGVILLGSGAENLEAAPKREFARSIIRLASILIDRWTREIVALNIQTQKNVILSDEFFRNGTASNANLSEAQLANLKSLLSGIFDLIEYSILASPSRAVLNFICDRARGRLLASSLEASEYKIGIEGMIFSAWLSDIDSKRGAHRLTANIKTLPQHRFLRVTLASHLMTRVYWDQGRADDRRALLDCAEEAIRPFMAMGGKAQIIRSIDKGSDVSAATKASKKGAKPKRPRKR